MCYYFEIDDTWACYIVSSNVSSYKIDTGATENAAPVSTRPDTRQSYILTLTKLLAIVSDHSLTSLSKSLFIFPITRGMRLALLGPRLTLLTLGKSSFTKDFDT